MTKHNRSFDDDSKIRMRAIGGQNTGRRLY